MSCLKGLMTSRIRLIGLVGAGAITSAAFCSLYLIYTVERSKATIAGLADSAFEQTVELLEEGSEPEAEATPLVAPERPRAEQAFLVAFLADANPQVRTLAAWGLMSSDEAGESQRELLEFVRQERNPEVRIALYRFMQGQRSIPCNTLVELVRQEEEMNQTWLASCDLLAGVVQSGSSNETKEFFNHTIVPKLESLALGAEDLHSRIAAIIALRRAGTSDAIEALRQIMRLSTDPQVVRAASSAVGFVVLE
jgi:hypothetical protein